VLIRSAWESNVNRTVTISGFAKTKESKVTCVKFKLEMGLGKELLWPGFGRIIF